jgi:hypothetical protein
MRTNLTAKTDNEKRILAYIEQNATDYLCTKINNGKKTLQGCWSYITAEAKKQAVNGCACIEDNTVYGWAMHYFEEDSITEPTPTKTTPKTPSKAPTSTAPKTTPKPTPKAEPPKPKTKPKTEQLSFQETEQLSFFDLGV